MSDFINGIWATMIVSALVYISSEYNRETYLLLLFGATTLVIIGIWIGGVL